MTRPRVLLLSCAGLLALNTYGANESASTPAPTSAAPAAGGSLSVLVPFRIQRTKAVEYPLVLTRSVESACVVDRVGLSELYQRIEPASTEASASVSQWYPRYRRLTDASTMPAPAPTKPHTAARVFLLTKTANAIEIPNIKRVITTLYRGRFDPFDLLFAIRKFGRKRAWRGCTS